MKQGTLIFDERTDRYDIRFDLADCYGGLHCRQCFDVMVGGRWKPTRIEYGHAQMGPPQSRMTWWGEEGQNSGMQFSPQAETEWNGFCPDEVGIRADDLNGLRVRI